MSTRALRLRRACQLASRSGGGAARVRTDAGRRARQPQALHGAPRSAAMGATIILQDPKPAEFVNTPIRLEDVAIELSDEEAQMLDGLRLPVYGADDGASFPTRPGRSWSWKRSCRRRQGVAALIPLFRGFPANSGVLQGDGRGSKRRAFRQRSSAAYDADQPARPRDFRPLCTPSSLRQRRNFNTAVTRKPKLFCAPW